MRWALSVCLAFLLTFASFIYLYLFQYTFKCKSSSGRSFIIIAKQLFAMMECGQTVFGVWRSEDKCLVRMTIIKLSDMMWCEVMWCEWALTATDLQCIAPKKSTHGITDHGSRLHSVSMSNWCRLRVKTMSERRIQLKSGKKKKKNGIRKQTTTNIAEYSHASSTHLRWKAMGIERFMTNRMACEWTNKTKQTDRERREPF